MSLEHHYNFVCLPTRWKSIHFFDIHSNSIPFLSAMFLSIGTQWCDFLVNPIKLFPIYWCLQQNFQSKQLNMQSDSGATPRPSILLLLTKTGHHNVLNQYIIEHNSYKWNGNSLVLTLPYNQMRSLHFVVMGLLYIIPHAWMIANTEHIVDLLKMPDESILD